MAKQLKDILKQAHDTIKGAHKSTTEPLSTGKDPGVDYKPKADDEADFIAKHSVEKWDEPYGNPNYADKMPYSLSKEKHHGNTIAKAKVTYEEVKYDDNSSDVKDWTHKKLKWHVEKQSSSSAKAHSEIKRRAKTGEQVKEETADIEEAYGSSEGKTATGTKWSDNSVSVSVHHNGNKQVFTGKHDYVAKKLKAQHGMSIHDVKFKKASDMKEEVLESKKAEDTKCNNTPGQTWCPIHEMTDCSSARQIKELSTDLLHRAAHKAAKVAMSDVQGRSGPIFKKRAAQANKFRAKGMEQEKKEKTAKSVKEETLVELSPATKKAYVAAATDDKKHAERQANHSEYTAKHAKTAKQRADFSNEAEWLKSIAAKRAKGIKMATKESVAPGQFSEPSDAAKAKVKQIQQKDADSAAIGRAKMGIKSEEVVNELSKKTLGNYVQAATRNALSRQYALGKGDKTDTHKLMNRRKGIDKAVDKLTKEEVIDEKHLTPAEMKKREEVAQAIHKKDPSMPMDKKMAIATSTAKKATKISHYRTDRNKHMEEEVNEDLAVPLLGGDHPPRGNSDEAAEMVKTELKALANKAMHLVMQMPDNMHVEPWVQAKIATAKELVSGVHDYMIYSDPKPEEDEGTMDTPMTFPNMSVDVNTGQNV